ncbi:hypothetical protein [Deinococcus depolymerans]|uniref:Uncharacterized protein n=1 Tax=Deinococcus depolymerans TaxID=392408 RepID=A0ABP3MNN4_9DEIO
MGRLRTLRTARLIQFWFNLIFTSLGGLGILAAVLIPNLLAARQKAVELGGVAPGGIGSAELGLILLIGVPALLVLRGLSRGQDMTVLRDRVRGCEKVLTPVGPRSVGGGRAVLPPG